MKHIFVIPSVFHFKHTNRKTCWHSEHNRTTHKANIVLQPADIINNKRPSKEHGWKQSKRIVHSTHSEWLYTKQFIHKIRKKKSIRPLNVSHFLLKTFAAITDVRIIRRTLCAQYLDFRRKQDNMQKKSKEKKNTKFKRTQNHELFTAPTMEPDMLVYSFFRLTLIWIPFQFNSFAKRLRLTWNWMY